VSLIPPGALVSLALSLYALLLTVRSSRPCTSFGWAGLADGPSPLLLGDPGLLIAAPLPAAGIRRCSTGSSRRSAYRAVVDGGNGCAHKRTTESQRARRF
jgi:hypothetical protein